MREGDKTIRTVKERGRRIVNTLKYYYLPPQIKIHLVYFIVMGLNALTYDK